MQKHIKLYEEFVGELALNEGAVVAKKKFPADEDEAGEDAFEWLMDTLDRVEDIEISDDEEEQVREATPEEVASFVSGLLDRHKIETKRSGRQIEIIVLKSKVNEQLVAEAEAEVKAILSYESPQSSEVTMTQADKVFRTWAQFDAKAKVINSKIDKQKYEAVYTLKGDVDKMKKAWENLQKDIEDQGPESEYAKLEFFDLSF
jgi:chemotaxis protein CheY-P-specific phosphatase CheC